MASYSPRTMLHEVRLTQSLVSGPNRFVMGVRPTTTDVGVMPVIRHGESAAAAPAEATTVEAARPSAAVAAARRRLGTEVLRWSEKGGRFVRRANASPG